MTMGFDEFASRHKGAADLDRIIEEVASVVSARVVQSRLEETLDDTFGPATRLLDICEVAQNVRDLMTRPEPANRKPDHAVIDAMLEANRTIADKAALKEAKAEILSAVRRGL